MVIEILNNFDLEYFFLEWVLLGKGMGEYIFYWFLIFEGEYFLFDYRNICIYFDEGEYYYYFNVVYLVVLREKGCGF